MFHSGVLFYPKVALRSNLRLKSSARTALCARAMQSMNRTRGCNGRGLHGTPDSCLASQGANGHLHTRQPHLQHQIWAETPSDPGNSRAASGTREESVSQGCSPGKGCFHNSNPRQLLSLLPGHQGLGRVFTTSWKIPPLLQNPSKCASSYLSCWLAVVAHHSKLEFNNLGVEQMDFPLCFYPECYQRETDNTMSFIQSCTWKLQYLHNFHLCLHLFPWKWYMKPSHLIFLLLSQWWNTKCVMSRSSLKIDLISSDCCLNSDSCLGL